MEGHGPAPAIKELGIKPYQWGTECLRGIVGTGTPTSFPQTLGLAATFNPDMIYEVAKATSIEVRSYNNYYVKNSDYQYHHGLSCWSPVINIVRDPRWGRNQETYGEDPYMSGVMASEFVRDYKETMIDISEQLLVVNSLTHTLAQSIFLLYDSVSML